MRFVLLLASSVVFVLSLGAQQPSVPDVVRNARGDVLRQPRVLAFDGETFQVEHADGVAAVPWDRMPVSMRENFKYDPETAAAARRRHFSSYMAQPERKAEIESATGSAPRSGSERQAQQPAASRYPPVKVERSIRVMQRVHLITIGGPNTFMTVQSVNDLEIVVRGLYRDVRTIPRKRGVGDALTLLHDDNVGCKTYLVDRVSRDPGEVILLFEHAANSRCHPERKRVNY